MNPITPAERTALAIDKMKQKPKVKHDVLKEDAPPRFEYVEVAKIMIDPDYQRAIDVDRAVTIAQSWDPALAQAIDVSLREDGTMWCIDGQHRLSAASLANHSVIAAMVHTGLSVEDEARTFWLLQKNRRGLNVWAAFKARLVAREPTATDIARIMAERGLKLGLGGKSDVQAVASVEQVYRWGGPTLLREVLAGLDRAWHLNSGRYDGPLISGAAIILRNYADIPNFDRDRLWDRLSTVTPRQVLAGASERSTTGHQKSGPGRGHFVASVMRELYNIRLSPARRLPPIAVLTATGKRRLPNSDE